MTHPATAVLGLGRLGAAVAYCLASAGVPLTVWNRDRTRAYALGQRARVAASAADACAAADLIVLCLADYHAAIEVMEDVSGEIDLAEKTLVQLGGGTPADARSMNAWTGMHGMHYLDGAPLTPAEGLGTPQATVLFAGDEARFARFRATLLALGGASRHLDEAVGAAATLQAALLDYYYGATFAMLHGAALCESEGVSLPDFFHGVKALGPGLADLADRARGMIDREIYAGVGAPLASHLAALRSLQRLAHDNEVEPRLPDLLVANLRKAAAGHGDEDLVALFEVLRRRDD
ncbi:MAG: NAD(P)-binding domain-containing protein [Gammaproteobacteria bacterium]|nr:NAD(P)-binding domain-containing protein [Gammaproteobacteria bacterium]